MKTTSAMARLRQANPAPEDPSPSRSGARKLRVAGQVLLAVVGVFVVGVGAAWAATGTNPVASLFGADIEVVSSDYGLDSLSILEPATQEKFDSLPEDLAFRAFAIATRNTISANVRDGLDPFNERGASRTEDFDPIPAEISAIGRGLTFSGTGVTMMVIEGEVCVYFGLRGPSECRTLGDIKNGLAFSSGDPSNRQAFRVFGVVTDDVASMRMPGSGLPPMPVSSNAFDIRNVEGDDFELIALDRNNREVFRCSRERLRGRSFGMPIECR